MINRILYLPKARRRSSRCRKVQDSQGSHLPPNLSWHGRCCSMSSRASLPVQSVTGDTVYGSGPPFALVWRNNGEPMPSPSRPRNQLSRLEDPPGAGFGSWNREFHLGTSLCGSGTKSTGNMDRSGILELCTMLHSGSDALLIRRHPDEKEDYAYYIVYAGDSRCRILGPDNRARSAVDDAFRKRRGNRCLDSSL